MQLGLLTLPKAQSSAVWAVLGLFCSPRPTAPERSAARYDVVALRSRKSNGAAQTATVKRIVAQPGPREIRRHEIAVQKPYAEQVGIPEIAAREEHTLEARATKIGPFKVHPIELGAKDHSVLQA